MFFSFRTQGLRVAVLIASLLLASSVQMLAQTPTKQWDRTFGGTDRDMPRAIQQTSDGGYIVGGSSVSSRNGDKSQDSQGESDYWVLKLDASGNKLWDRAFGGTLGDYLDEMQPTDDGGYILAGNSNSNRSGDKSQDSRGDLDCWIVKLDANGNKLWDRTIGGDRVDYLGVLQKTSDGGYIIGGPSYSGRSGDKSQDNRGDQDYWIVKLDANGNKLWDRTFGGNRDDTLYDLKLTSDGGYILGGTSLSDQSGEKSQNNQGGSDYWVVKLDANGNKLWDRTIGSTGLDRLYVVQQDRDGGYILGGSSEVTVDGDRTQPGRGGSDYWIVKLDANGNKLWDRIIGGSGNDELADLQLSTDGGYLLGGNSSSDQSGEKSQNRRGGSDYWVVKLDANRNKLWDYTFGGTQNDAFTTLQQTSDGGWILSGASNSPLSGDKTQDGQGDYDYWIVKLSSETVTGTASAIASHTWSVYPNPARSNFILHLPEAVPHSSLHLSLLDATGHMVLTQSLTATGGDILVEVGQHPAGLYLLRVEGPNGILATQRLILQ